MTSERQRNRSELDSRIKSLSKEKQELLGLLLRQEQVDTTAPVHGQGPLGSLHANLVTLQPFGTKPPLFCLPPVFGTVFPYYNLVPGLGLDQPVYAVSPQGIDGKARPHDRIEDMAEHAIAAIRSAQPAGPYRLVGYSFGGVIAFEVAHQLRASGDDVGLLAMVDTWAPMTVRQHGVLKTAALCLEVMSKGWLFVADYIALILTTRSQRSSSKGNEAARLLEMVAVSTVGISPPAVRTMLRVYLANMKALRRYEPQSISQVITFFRTGKPSCHDLTDQTRGWSELSTSDSIIHRMPGDHISIMRPPHVQVFANALAASLTPS